MHIELLKAIRGFQLSNEAAGLSYATIRSYTGNLNLFEKWLAEQSGKIPMLDEVTTDDIREYLNELRTRQVSYKGHRFTQEQSRSLSPRTVLGYYTSLSAFFNWAVREELLSDSPMRKIRRPRVPKYIPEPFSEEEMRGLIAATHNLPEESRLREQAILLFLLDTGVRLSELLGAKLSDLDNLEQGRIKVFGKGAKERFVYFGSTTRKALWRYVSLSRSEPRMNADNLFLSFEGLPIAHRRLSFLLHRLGEVSGVQRVHPHPFRRTAAIQFLRNGNFNVLALQKLLGHESLEMVRRYVDLAADDVAQAHRESSPVDGWKL